MQLVMTIIAASIALAYGVIALLLPHRIQRWMTHDRLHRVVALKVYGRFVQSPKYILYLRLTGAASIAASALLFSSAFFPGGVFRWR